MAGSKRWPVRKPKNPQRVLPLKEHLKELQVRLVISLIALLVGTIAGWFFYDPVLVILKQPIDDVAQSQGRTAELNFASIVSPFDLRVKISIFISAVISSPIWIYQLSAFLIPGMNKTERKYAFGFVLAALPLFLAGTALAFFALPRAIHSLGMLIPEGASYIVQAQEYLQFVMVLIVVFGIAFILPVIMVGLNLLGLLSARTIRRSWRWVVVLVFAFAAIATPSTDAVSMFYLVLPMLLMFFLAWLVCAINDARRKKKMIAEGTWVEPV